MSHEPDLHLLKRLVLPDRYEVLQRHLGAEVAQLLVDPGPNTRRSLGLLARGVTNTGHGAFVPLAAFTGTGKTTLAANLSVFLPNDFAATVLHDGEVSARALEESVRRALGQSPESRLIPINIDHRESVPPADAELSELKRFLRGDLGSRAVVFWPETSATLADEMVVRWRNVAGEPPIKLPLAVEGPDRNTWVQTAISTLRLSNEMIDDLELLGVNPSDYDPSSFGSIGEFLRAISRDFGTYIQELVDATEMPLQLYVIFVSQSATEGILAQLTTGGRFGFVDGHATLQATADSRIGRWWSEHRGLLTQALVRLDVRALCLPPTASIPSLRRYGHEEVKQALIDLDIGDEGDARVARALGRTDFGRLLRGEPRSASETRGTPSTQADPAFELVADAHGFGGGRDKRLNAAVADAIRTYLVREDVPFTDVAVEKALPKLKLIPDIAVSTNSVTICIEPTWRKGDFLSSSNRSTIAQYILTKIHNYCDVLGWISGR